MPWLPLPASSPGRAGPSAGRAPSTPAQCGPGKPRPLWAWPGRGLGRRVGRKRRREERQLGRLVRWPERDARGRRLQDGRQGREGGEPRGVGSTCRGVGGPPSGPADLASPLPRALLGPPCVQGGRWVPGRRAAGNGFGVQGRVLGALGGQSRRDPARGWGACPGCLRSQGGGLELPQGGRCAEWGCKACAHRGSGGGGAGAPLGRRV